MLRTQTLVLLVAAGCADDLSRGVGPTPGAPTGWGDGSDPGKRVERFTQPDHFAIDLLWVVDNAWSMSEEQKKLAYNYSSFADELEVPLLDWHVGVITTDMADASHQGRLREVDAARWIQPDTEDPAWVFVAMASVGTSGLAPGATFDAIVQALTTQSSGYNLGFRRHSAPLEIVVVSDADDASTLGIQDFLRWYATFDDDRDHHGFSAIVTPLEGCPEAGNAPGLAYLAVTRTLGGVEGDLCAIDWRGTLAAIGARVAGRQREHFLSETPAPGSLRVALQLSDELVDLTVHEYLYDPARNSVLLRDLPAPGTVVRVGYEVE